MDFTKLMLKLAPIVLQAIGLAQEIQGATGPDKKAAAIRKSIEQGAVVVENAFGKDAVNESALAEAAGHVIDGVFAAKDAIKAAKKLRTPDGTPAAGGL